MKKSGETVGPSKVILNINSIWFYSDNRKSYSYATEGLEHGNKVVCKEDDVSLRKQKLTKWEYIKYTLYIIISAMEYTFFLKGLNFLSAVYQVENDFINKVIPALVIIIEFIVIYLILLFMEYKKIDKGIKSKYMAANQMVNYVRKKGKLPSDMKRLKKESIGKGEIRANGYMLVLEEDLRIIENVAICICILESLYLIKYSITIFTFTMLLALSLKRIIKYIKRAIIQRAIKSNEVLEKDYVVAYLAMREWIKKNHPEMYIEKEDIYIHIK